MRQNEKQKIYLYDNAYKNYEMWNGPNEAINDTDSENETGFSSSCALFTHVR
jgi:hypothetical protein